MTDINFDELDELEKEEKSKLKTGRSKRNVAEQLDGNEKTKTVTSISLPTPLFHAVNEYCSKVGISKAAFFSQLAFEKLKDEELDTEF